MIATGDDWVVTPKVYGMSAKAINPSFTGLAVSRLELI